MDVESDVREHAVVALGKIKGMLPDLFTQYVPDQHAIILGATYWNTLGTTAETGVAKLVFGGLFGAFGLMLAGNEHRAGIVAVTESDLSLVDLETVVGEDLNLEKMCKAIGPPSVKRHFYRILLRNTTRRLVY